MRVAQLVGIRRGGPGPDWFSLVVIAVACACCLRARAGRAGGRPVYGEA
jgi:hypothetical protein